MPSFVYILKCSDGSYYTGSTGELEHRIAQHKSGLIPGYTKSRLPVELAWSESFKEMRDAIAAERQIKGWSRAKKEALIKGDFELLKELSKSRQQLEISCFDYAQHEILNT